MILYSVTVYMYASNPVVVHTSYFIVSRTPLTLPEHNTAYMKYDCNSNKPFCRFAIIAISGVSRISFRGGVQNFSEKEKICKNGAIWCVLESILLKFCQKNNLKNSHFLYKNNR